MLLSVRVGDWGSQRFYFYKNLPWLLALSHKVINNWHLPAFVMFFTSKFSEKVRPSSSWWLSSWRVNSWKRMEFNPLLSGCMEASWERPGARATFHHHPVCSRDSARSTNKDTHVCCCFPGVCVCVSLCVCLHHSAGFCRGTFDYPVLREPSPRGVWVISLWI